MNQKEAIKAAKALPWAKWVAQDGDGRWCAYDVEPHAHWDGLAIWSYTGDNFAYLGNDSGRLGPKVEITP